MDPSQGKSAHAREDYTFLEDNTLESFENLFDIPDDSSAIFPSLHQQAAVNVLHQPGISTPGASGSIFLSPSQVASGHDSTSVIEPDDTEFDTLVDWSGHRPAPLEMNDSGINNFSNLGQLVFPHGDQDWALSQYSRASTSYLHQATRYSRQLNAVDEQSSSDFQNLKPADVTQQPFVQEPITFLWPVDNNSATFLTTDDADATSSTSLADQSWDGYNTANVHYPSFQSFADRVSFQQLESQGNSNLSFDTLIDYPETWNSFPSDQMNTQLDNTIARFDIPSQAQHNSSFSINEQNYFPSTGCLEESQTPSHLPILHNTTQTPRIAGDIEGMESTASPLEIQPNTQSTRELPKARRGGRRGPLTEEQAQSQQVARLSGVCIRCRKTRIKCTGGIPCDACRATSKSRIWKTPCTKAQFLDIVESGSYFPLVATQEIIAIEAQGMGDLFLQLVLIECLVKADKCASVTGIPLGTKCAIPWSIWKESMGSVLFGMLEESGAKIHICGSDSAGPSTSRSVSGLKLLMNKHPSGECVQFDANVFRPGSPTWTHAIITFCMACPFLDLEDLKVDEIVFPFKPEEMKKDYLRDATLTLIWIAARYLELCLFRYLQWLSNDLAERPTEEQKAYIICMFQVLLFNGGITASELEISGLDANDPYIQTVCQNFLDRQNRLRMALWVYISIAISKLPAWSNIWGTLQERWPLLSGRHMAEQFHSSLAAFDTSAGKKIEPLYKSFDILNKCISVMGELYNEFDFEYLDYQPIRSNEEMARYRLVISDYLGNIRAKIDQHTAIGALSFEAEEQRKVLSVLAFTFLANVKWKATSSKPTGIQDAIQTGELYLSHFMDRVASRRYVIGMADSLLKFAKKIATIPDNAIEVLTTSLRTIYDTGNGQIETGLGLGDLRVCLRTGQRWKELKDIFGAETLLLGSPPQLFRRNPSLLLDIPGAVEAASDSQFAELKKIMSTEFRWLKETCAKLGGVYELIQTLDKANEKEANAISDQIQSHIHTTFGDTSFIHRLTIRESALLDPFPLVLRTRRMLLEEPGSTKGRQTIVDRLIKDIAVIYWDGMSLESRKEMRQTVNELAMEKNLDTSIRDWTLKALDSLFDSFDAGTGRLGN